MVLCKAFVCIILIAEIFVRNKKLTAGMLRRSQKHYGAYSTFKRSQIHHAAGILMRSHKDYTAGMTRLDMHNRSSLHDDSDVDPLTSASGEDSCGRPFSDGYTVQTEGCKIPGMDEIDNTINGFMNYPTEASKCSYDDYPLINQNTTHIQILEQNILYHQYNRKKIRCCYKYIDIMLNATDAKNKVKYSRCKGFDTAIRMSNEFVKVLCSYNNQNIYEQFFVFTPKKSDSYSYPMLYPLIPSKINQYHVIVMGFSALSRLNFHRTMPNTLNLLRQKDVIEFMGYNALSTSEPNIMPLLIGRIPEAGVNQSTSSDKSSFIWDRYKQSGFYTAFGEDTAQNGILNSGKDGFQEFKTFPTDYYLRPFIQETEEESQASKLCMRDKFYYRVLLDYVEDLIVTYKSSKLFGLFWESSVSHNSMNLPMLLDQSYSSLIEKLDKSGLLSKTFLVLVSDHGVKASDIQNVTQGPLEERLPFLFVLTPPEFRKEYGMAYENLQHNAHKLTTALDLHQTLADLAHLSVLKNSSVKSRMKAEPIANGVSLFLPISTKRTCAAAGVSENACTCLKTKSLPVASETVKRSSRFLLRNVNNLLTPYPQCEQLTAYKIVEAMELVNGYNLKSNMSDMVVVVATTPGDAVLEGTIRRYGGSSHDWAMMGTVNRLNPNPEQGLCVSDPLLKHYCHCDPAYLY